MLQNPGIRVFEKMPSDKNLKQGGVYDLVHEIEGKGIGGAAGQSADGFKRRGSCQKAE
ncbi:hypothetical protein D3C87_1842300 [compost metagenome]